MSDREKRKKGGAAAALTVLFCVIALAAALGRGRDGGLFIRCARPLPGPPRVTVTLCP
ncbi:MAG: hypothetical protein IJU52_04215 [Clostridia bacterium]|nr:hypothetical protein [Clostridia bacterium]